MFYAERGMRMLFTAEQAAALTGRIRNHTDSASAASDEQYVLCDERSGRPLARVRYRICTTSGQVFSGVTDFEGNTQRVTTRHAEKIRLEVVEESSDAV